MRSLYAPLIKLVIFLVITALAFYVLAVTIANSSFGSTYTYHADFKDVTGLNLNDDVRIAGVRVGTVTDMQLKQGKPSQADKTSSGKPYYPSSYTAVTFTVQKSRSLPMSVAARLRYRNLVGQRYLDVEQCASELDAASQNSCSPQTTILKPGGLIPIDHTAPAVDLTVLFGGFTNLTQALDGTQINNLTSAIIQTLQGEGGGLENLLRTVGDLSNTLADKDQVIGDVIDNLTSVLQTLGQRDVELSNLIIQLRSFVSGLATDRTTIGDAIDGINGLAKSTTNLLTNVRPPLKADVKDITGLVNNLNANSGVVTYILQQLAPTVAGLIRTASYGSWFNFYLCHLKVTVTVPGITTVTTKELPVDELTSTGQSTNAIRGCSN